MRMVQMIGLIAGLVAFVIAAVCAGQAAGDTWWRVGMAIMVTDMVLILLGGPRPAKS